MHRQIDRYDDDDVADDGDDDDDDDDTFIHLSIHPSHPKKKTGALLNQICMWYNKVIYFFLSLFLAILCVSLGDVTFTNNNDGRNVQSSRRYTIALIWIMWINYSSTVATSTTKNTHRVFSAMMIQCRLDKVIENAMEMATASSDAHTHGTKRGLEKIQIQFVCLA